MATLDSVDLYMGLSSARSGWNVVVSVYAFANYSTSPNTGSLLGAKAIDVSNVPRTVEGPDWVNFTFDTPIDISSEVGWIGVHVTTTAPSQFQRAPLRWYRSSEFEVPEGSPYTGTEKYWYYDGSWVQLALIGHAYKLNTTDCDNNDALTPNDSYRSFSGYPQQGIRSYLNTNTPPTKAENPTPADGATNVDFSGLQLSWDDGGGADTFDVYMGPVGALVLISSAQAGTTLTVDTGDVPWGETIYWRIDSTNAEGTTTGDTWSFDVVVIRSVKLGANGAFIVVAAKDGVYLSTDSGANWNRKTPDAVEDTDWEKGICSSDGTYIIVVNDADAIYRSANSGSSWAQITPAGGDTFSVNKMATSDDGQFMVIVGQNSTDATESCYISTDYGATWTAKKPVAASIEWTECDISNDGTVITVSTTGDFFISLDSGATWKEQGMASTAEVWEGLSISGDGTTGLVANTNDNDEFFIGINTELFSEATWAESTITAAGRALIDDATVADQNTTLGFGTGDSPTLTGLTLTGLTPTRLVQSGSALNSVADLTAWIAGTANQIIVTDDEDGTVTLSAPQNIHTGASPTFAGITILDATPILIFRDSDGAGSASVGFIEWRDSGGGRAGFFGNSSSGNDDLVWKNEQGGDIVVQTTGAGEFQIFADTVLNNNSITGIDNLTASDTVQAKDFLIDGTQDYILSTRGGGEATLVSQTDDALSMLELYSKKGDGGDSVGYALYAQGIPGVFANFEKLEMTYDGTDKYEIKSSKAGSGQAHSIGFTIGIHEDQLLLAANGNIFTLVDLSVGGNLSIGDGAVDVDYTLSFIGESRTGVITWMEDDGFFLFDHDVELAVNLTVDGLTASLGVYTNAAKKLVSTRPAVDGDFGLWNLAAGVLTPIDDDDAAPWDVQVGNDITIGNDILIDIAGKIVYASVGIVDFGTGSASADLTFTGTPGAGLASNVIFANANGGSLTMATTLAATVFTGSADLTFSTFAGSINFLGLLGINLNPVSGVITLGDGGDTNFTQINVLGTINQFGSAVATLNLTTSSTQTEWDAAFDNMVTAIAFEVTDGIITITQQDSGTLATDSLDGRYYTETELGSVSNGLGASLLGIEDAMSLYAGTDVEAALEEVMDMIIIETHVADSFEVGGDQVGIVTGIVENTQVINDGDELILNETTGGPNPNFVQTFEFSGITTGHEPNLIELHWYYSPVTTPHTISVQMYNYNTSTWDVIDNTTFVATGGTLTFSSITIIDGGGTIVDYTSGGVARVRFSHDDNGIAAHDFGIDYLAIKDDHGIGSGITDHGSLSGLQDDDHDPLYHTDGRAATWLTANHETTFTHADIATNTSKITNATHTSEVTGSGALTAQPIMITGKNAATVASGDLVLVSDINDSNILKKVTAQSIGDLGDNDKVGIDTGATPDFIGAASNDGVLRTGAGLTYVDGGNFVTLAVSGTFVNRGDPSSVDFVAGDLTLDRGWYDMDLSSIVPAGAKSVLIRLEIADDVIGTFFMFRKNGNSNTANVTLIYTQVANIAIEKDGVIACDVNRIIEYRGDNTTFNFIGITVKGWWI